MSAGMALSNDKACFVTGWMNPSARRVQRLAVEIQFLEQRSMRPWRSAHRPDRRATDGRSTPCGRAPGGSARFPVCIRPVRRPLSGVMRRQCVTACLPCPSPVTIAIFLRLPDERARGASTVPLAGQRHARHDRQIAPVDRMLGELPRQPFVRDVILGDQHQPRRVLVDAVDDARAAPRRRCPTGCPRNGGAAR